MSKTFYAITDLRTNETKFLKLEETRFEDAMTADEASKLFAYYAEKESV